MHQSFVTTVTLLPHPSPTRPLGIAKVSKGAKIRNRYNQVPHLTQDTNGKVTNSQLDTTNGSQKVSPSPAGDHKADINRHTQWHTKRKTEKIKDPQKKYRLGTVSKIIYWIVFVEWAKKLVPCKFRDDFLRPI